MKSIFITSAWLLTTGSHQFVQQHSIAQGLRTAAEALARSVGSKHATVYAIISEVCSDSARSENCHRDRVSRAALQQNWSAFADGLSNNVQTYSETTIRELRRQNSLTASRTPAGKVDCTKDSVATQTFHLVQVRQASDSMQVTVELVETGALAGCAIGGIQLTARLVREGTGYRALMIQKGAHWSGLLEVPEKR